MTDFNYLTITKLEQLIATIIDLKLDVDIDKITNAYKYSEIKHKDQLRNNGDLAISHALTVANYIAQLRLDETSIIVALAHDVVEKCGTNIDEIDHTFGTTVAFIIDGLNNIRKFSKNINGTQSDSEVLKQLIFNSTEDVRILIVRIAEKIHNLLTLTDFTSEQAIKAAERALLIYAPLSEYLNLSGFQKTLEDKAFEILYPKEYRFINDAVEEVYQDQKDIINQFQNQLSTIFSQYNISNLQINSRRKGKYSIYRKIKKKYMDKYGGLNHESFSRVLDIFASRVLVNSVEECYMVLGLIQSNFEMIQEDFADYIADPKENGYRSIHTIVRYLGKTFEVQIKTHEMHEINEYGSASHIAYKSKGSINTADMTWTKDLVKWQGSSEKEIYKLKAFSNSIFVFTPKGLVIRLEKGSTPIDFAFRIHTEIGKRYTGSKVNGKMVNMSAVLNTGDVVEILTQKKPNVSIDWVNIAKMNSTKNKIRRSINLLKTD
jgi:GTP pyrophosphokinase